MDFGLTEEQTELAGLTRKILAAQDAPWGDLAAAGVLAAGVPLSLGRGGLRLLGEGSVLIELGRSPSSVPYLASIVLGAGALACFGTAAQLQRWAAPAGQGSVVLTAALAEEDGDAPRVPSARAERADGQWVLTGVKTAVDAAPEADLFLVPCASPDGVLVLLVAPSDAGVRVEPQQLTDFGSAGRVVLDGCVLSDDRMLGGVGGAVAGWLVGAGTGGVGAKQAGGFRRGLGPTP